MMSIEEKCAQFRALHTVTNPLVLFNVWDAGTAKAAQAAGASALATGSWSVAAAQGYDDGEQLPLAQLLRTVERISASTDLPVSVDFEGGYARDASGLAENTQQLLATGVVGINFEDQIVGGAGLFDITEQTARLKAVADAATATRRELFINARTDLFLHNAPDTHASLVDDAIARAAAYQKAGASGFFVPGLTDATLIRRIVDNVALPVNIMQGADLPTRQEIGEWGIARISYGPRPYIDAMNAFESAARQAFR